MSEITYTVQGSWAVLNGESVDADWTLVMTVEEPEEFLSGGISQMSSTRFSTRLAITTNDRI